MTTYVHRRDRVAAIQWTVDNFDAVKRFAAENIGDSDEIGLRCEPFELHGRVFNVLQFYAWNDDQEVDPGQWIVVHLERDPDVASGEILSSDDFRCSYEAEGDRT